MRPTLALNARRVASQVHEATSRLLQTGSLKELPAWYSAVTDYPPLPLPPRAPPQRPDYDLPKARHSHQHAHHTPQKHSRTPRPKVDAIEYPEDRIRRQFFMDHPFEAYRPRSMIENAPGVEIYEGVSGEAWKRLRQRGRNPSPEDVIKFTLNLHDNLGVPLSEAYATAVAQYRSLRSEHRVATAVAILEAEAMGAQFGPTEIERGFELEAAALKSWETGEGGRAAATGAGKQWSADAPSQFPGSWTRGQEYVSRWKEGATPYAREFEDESTEDAWTQTKM
ncbi:ribosomal protein S25 [Rhizoctonia solani 123E]|uniref:Small ribosomal subunit protein mS23 n=1 Tax=Rhizoctonia solani 123E TaxID=1423351 RepID=A0A074S6U8_9AGAM|nr:ribosomal protein S25 [Rhizoctonia solani 123E]